MRRKNPWKKPGLSACPSYEGPDGQLLNLTHSPCRYVTDHFLSSGLNCVKFARAICSSHPLIDDAGSFDLLHQRLDQNIARIEHRHTGFGPAGAIGPTVIFLEGFITGTTEADRHRPPARLPERRKNTFPGQHKRAVG